MTSGTGTCTVKYDQAGDANYDPAPQVTASVTATKASQAITVTTPAPASAIYNTSFTVAATGGGSGPRDVQQRRRVLERRRGVHDDELAPARARSTTTRRATQLRRGAAGHRRRSRRRRPARRSRSPRRHRPVRSTTPASPWPRPAAVGRPGDRQRGRRCARMSSATFTMTSGTGTCTVHYDQAGDATTTPRRRSPRGHGRRRPARRSRSPPAAPATAVYNTSFTVAATAGRSAITVSDSATGRLPQRRRHLHDDERHRHLHGAVQPGG